MGLFDMFGAGGGSLTLQLQTPQVQPGGMLSGIVLFTGGTRAQNVTSIKVRLTVTQQQPSVPGKPPAGSSTTNVVPEQTLSGPFQAQPGQQCPFQFSIQLPPQMIAEVRGQVDYRVSASADIPGEVDQHANADVQVMGGAMPGMGMGQPMMGQALMGQPMMGQPMMQAPMGPPQMGQQVMGQHPMGGAYPGRVVALQNGMIGVDWDDPNLGQSTWLQPHQVQPMQQPMMGQPMMGQQQPMMGKDMSAQKGMMQQKDMMHQKDMAAHKPHDMNVHKGEPHKPGLDPHAKGGTFAMGANVVAQHPQHGGWFPGRVVGMQNGMIAVDWADPKLGASAWVAAHQVQHHK